jgi:hypothetical protein
MKLFLLRPKENLPKCDNPWKPWYDKAFGFVIRAESEVQARQLAHHSAGDENRCMWAGEKIADTTAPWLDAKYSICIELVADGEPSIVMRDFAAA